MRVKSEEEFEESIDSLYRRLTSPEFQCPENIFYNYYIYQYPASAEYNLRKAIGEFKENLKRPNTYINAMTLDLFDTFCEYLKSKQFGKEGNYFDATIEDEKNGLELTVPLADDANSDGFIKHINKKIINHIESNKLLKTPYVFIYGVGKIFPYMRASIFLSKYEQYNDTSRYKIILFYPGHESGNSYSLFDRLEDFHTYRATLLVNRQ